MSLKHLVLLLLGSVAVGLCLIAFASVSEPAPPLPSQPTSQTAPLPDLPPLPVRSVLA